jgi:hypothetical protein
VTTQRKGGVRMLMKDLCKNIYVNELKHDNTDESWLSLWYCIVEIVEKSYNEGYEDGRKKRNYKILKDN